MGIDIFLFLVIVIFSIIIHEVSHGYAAYLCGDNTAKDEGRITINPVKHIDILGTIIIPIILIITKAQFLFGWAKPVPYNTYNLKGRYAEAFVTSAGALSNIALAIVFGVLYRSLDGVLSDGVLEIFLLVIMVNMFLAVLNMIPLPPLDGSRFLLSIMPIKWRAYIESSIIGRMLDSSNIFALILVLLFLVFFLVEFIYFLSISGTIFLSGANILDVQQIF